MLEGLVLADADIQYTKCELAMMVGRLALRTCQQIGSVHGMCALTLHAGRHPGCSVKGPGPIFR